MDVEKSSLCNCVVNFLLEENYLLTAFELLHELLDDGRDDQAIRLKDFFSDSSQFPPDQISRFNALRGDLSHSLISISLNWLLPKCSKPMDLEFSFFLAFSLSSNWGACDLCFGLFLNDHLSPWWVDKLSQTTIDYL